MCAVRVRGLDNFFGSYKDVSRGRIGEVNSKELVKTRFFSKGHRMKLEGSISNGEEFQLKSTGVFSSNTYAVK